MMLTEDIIQTNYEGDSNGNKFILTAEELMVSTEAGLHVIVY